MLVSKREVEKKLKERDKDLEKEDYQFKKKLRGYRKDIEKNSTSEEAKSYALRVADRLCQKQRQNKTAHEIRKYSTIAKMILGLHYTKLEEIGNENEPFEEALSKLYPVEKIKEIEEKETKAAKRAMDELDNLLGQMPGFSELLSNGVRK